MNSLELKIYENSQGKSPFLKWIKSLTSVSRAIIHKRITRLEAGHFGDAKVIKGASGLYELRVHEGPGYRVYFGRLGNTIVVLLCGGKKSTQISDISKAKNYWIDYLENNRG